MTIQSIFVVGAGAWGAALAAAARRAGRDVTIWAYEPETVEEINARHTNHLYLPGVTLDRGIRATARFSDAGEADAILLAPPAQSLRAVCEELAPHVASGKPAVICAKGFEQSTGKLLSEVVNEALRQASVAVLTGPSFAAEVARGQPAAVVLATPDQALGQTLAHALSSPSLRPYWSADLIGAEIGGAVKNVLAIAAGIVAGKGLGASAHAALVTRGFAEMLRFAAAYGAHPTTLSGLAGLGDLILTCSSQQSRNMSLGRALGEGRTLSDILGGRHSVSEGVYTASAVVAMASDKGVEMPICAAVDGVVSGRIGVDDAIGALMSRPLRAEG